MDWHSRVPTVKRKHCARKQKKGKRAGLLTQMMPRKPLIPTPFLANEMAEQTFLRSAISEVLPDLAEASKDILEETLQSIGVETYDDFQFIVEEDLLSALRPIQARKALAAWKFRSRTPETSRSSSNASPDTPPSQPSLSPLSVSSNSSSSNQTSAADWMDTFEIPWEKFSEELMQALERGKRPSPKMRKEMVRIVVSEMMRKSSYLGKRSSTEVAKKMVAKYPKSLQDVIDGDVIGPGYHSLKQLQYRIENVKRSTMPKIRKNRELQFRTPMGVSTGM
ncbi:uncharacterized protein LOC122819446 [Gambusia affinis]|uniref:uncharacterized protein LOC122819446 n=1 Tax=Gambusia affinis TaxID=33528 RepID=UPI001CDCD432|nr:uncharacterized protein LOC122819446 [Gambusia affinis]